MPGPGCGPTPFGVPESGCGPTPLGALVLVSWPDRLGGVVRHPPGTVADPPRLRLRQWVAVSAASETACRRAAVHRCLGGPPRVVRFHLVSPACARRQAVTALREAHPLPQPTPSGRPTLGVVQPPGGARVWVWSNPLGVPGPGCGPTPWGCIQVPSGNRRGPVTTEAAAMGRSERSERDSLPPSGAAPSRLPGHRWPSPAPRRNALSTLPPTIS